jgi:glucose 1-dehydrogenase
MKAIAVVPGTKTVQLVDRPEPSIVAPDDIKLRVLRVGICGTDREEAAGGRAKAAPAHQDLVLGHEMFGQVVDVGRTVTLVKPGDYAVFTVRRGCGTCRPCVMNRSDMCRTGLYAERGIWGLDGYQTEFVVDREAFAVRVAPELEAVGVLAEPFSVAEKAISEAVHLQLTRLPDMATSLDWLSGKRCLVAGLGPIGLLAALSLRLRHAEVWGLDVVDANREAAAQQRDPDIHKGAVQGDRLDDEQQGNANVPPHDESGLPAKLTAIAEDRIGANVDDSEVANADQTGRTTCASRDEVRPLD